MRYKSILIAFTLVSSSAVSAQDTTQLSIPQDGYYRQNALESASPFAYPKVNSNNIQFYRRIWRDIDLNDSANRVLNTPGASLMAVILDAIKEGKITAFDATSTKENPRGDAFNLPLKPQQGLAKLQDSVLVPIYDDNGNQVRTEMRLNDFNPETVTKFRIKEDIFFDKQRSRVETRIIGIAPLIKINAAGEMISEQPAFWLYYPQCREWFAKKEVVDPQRSIYKMSFDDIFIQHKFNGVIVKESNPADLSIKDYVDSNGQMKEASRIEEQLANYKNNIWKY